MFSRENEEWGGRGGEGDGDVDVDKEERDWVWSCWLATCCSSTCTSFFSSLLFWMSSIVRYSTGSIESTQII